MTTDPEAAHFEAAPMAHLEALFQSPPSDASKRISATFVEKYAHWFGRERILDAGAGFGINALLFALAGAREVLAVDLRPDRIADLDRLAKLAELDAVLPICADYAEIMRSRGPFDLVVCSYFLSHLAADEVFLDLCRSSLSPGGQLYLVDDNNALSPWRQVTVRREWWQAELAGNRDNALGFLPQRRAAVDAALPSGLRMPRWLVREYCAWATRGMTVFDAAAYARWRVDPSNPRPPRAAFDCCDPENGIPEERLLNPIRIAAELRKRGFAVDVFPASDTGGPAVRSHAARLIRALAPEFELVATHG
jgi:SAM-dependent methyltransferase